MTQNRKLAELTAEILASYVQRNPLQTADLPRLIRSVHETLAGALHPAPIAAAITKPSPSQVRKSITPEHLISFEDGRGYKVLRRHLTTRGMTPEAYREKWGLPLDYPMTAPRFSEARSQLVKNRNLCRKARSAVG